MLLCGWHIQKNISSKLSHLSKKDNSLFHKILNLPFITSKQKFKKTIEEFKDSENLSQSELEYIEMKLLTKEEWAKSETKSAFAGIEGLHGVLKSHLNSDSRLQELFECFQDIESTLGKKKSMEYYYRRFF